MDVEKRVSRITDDLTPKRVWWQPALDVARLAIGGQLFALAFILVVRSILRRR